MQCVITPSMGRPTMVCGNNYKIDLFVKKTGFICFYEFQHYAIFANVNCNISSFYSLLAIVIHFHWGLIKGLGGLSSFYLSPKTKPFNGWTVCLINCIASNLSFLCHVGSAATVRHGHSRLKCVRASAGIYCKIIELGCTSIAAVGTHFAGLHPDALGKAAQTMQGPRQEQDVCPDFAYSCYLQYI